MQIRTGFTGHAVLLALLTLLIPALAGCGPCRAKVGNLCYDKQDASMPPLRASWQLLDAETGKGIPGAWISLRWQGTTPPGQRRACERGELGRTDQDGRFSTIGKDGASRIYDIGILATGYEELRFEYIGDSLEAVVRLAPGELERYALWIAPLKDLGYRYEDASGPRMVKKLRAPRDYQDLVRSIYHENGQPVLMVTRRALPNDPNIAGRVMPPCINSGTQNVGYESEDYATAQRIYRRQNYDTFCDRRWQTLSESDLYVYLAPNLTRLLIQFIPPGGGRDFLEKHAPSYLQSINRPGQSPVFLHQEWTNICTAILPLVDQVVRYE